MSNKIKRVVKNGLRKAAEHRKMLACAFIYGMMQANRMICYADTAEKNDVTDGLVTIKTLVLTVVGTIGVIYLAKSILEFASAYQQSDSSGMNSALKGIVGGLMTAGISGILTLLGYK